MSNTPRPQWQLPPGVTRGLWEYAHTDSIADDYDACFAENKLFDFDEQVLSRHFTQRDAWVADLGCGTGRALVPLVRRGFRGVAVDLSERMLQVVRRKAECEDLPIQCVRANLVELDCFSDDAIDYAMCLFSTLGMIRGWQNRQRVLNHVWRMLRPGGVFVLHVHNFWYNLYDPGGPWWVLSNYLRAAVRRDIEPGDKFFPYCGVNNMFLHVFTHGELRRTVRRAGFTIREMIPLDPRRVRALPLPWLLGRLRANGWIIVCEKPLG